MTVQTVLATIRRLQTSVEVLCGIGAELRVRREGLTVDSNLQARLLNVFDAVDVGLLSGLTPEQEEMLLFAVQSLVGQAKELLDDPGLPPGWSSDDPAVLQGQGLLSRRFVGAIDRLGQSCPALGSALRRPGTFLDVGTGVGWLAIEAARTWPKLQFIGLDVWDPALRIARANIVGAGLENRIVLRRQGVESMEDEGVFTIAWLPPFIPEALVDRALANLHRSLMSGGWLILSLLGAMPGELERSLAALKLARYGSFDWTPSQAELKLCESGFDQVQTFSPDPLTMIVVGRKPDQSIALG